jgi:hypothetical protein
MSNFNFFCVLQPEDILDCRAHKSIIPYHVRCGPILKKLGLYLLALITHTKTDRRLMTALVER